MANLTKAVTISQAGEGSLRLDSNEGQSGRQSTERPGKVTTTESGPETTAITRSTPGKSTATTTETSPERRTTETKQPVLNRTVSEASEVVQKQGEQKTLRTGREDAGAQVTFTFRISDFL